MAMTAGAALLTRLKQLGVDCIFANSGTDFPPIIEGLAEAEARGIDLPEPIVIPHEGAAIAMAHGYYLGSGRAQAVIAHTNVGLANCVLGAINAATEQVPILLMSGRTPVLEGGRLGARSVPIGWGQEMHDQAAMVREPCKWDYELRFPEQICDVLDRAHGIAHSTPRGPIYLSLPREVLCETVPDDLTDRRPQMQPSIAAPRPDDIASAARILAEAKHPVIFAQRGAGSAEGYAALSDLTEKWGIPVCQYWATQLAMSTSHPMAADADPVPLLAEADAILAIGALAPWSPGVANPEPDCTVIQMGEDPLQARFPIRNFRADLNLPGEIGPTLLALTDAMAPRYVDHAATCVERHRVAADRNAKDLSRRRARAEAGRDAPRLGKAWVSHALAQAVKDRDAAIFNELGCMLPFMALEGPESWFDGPLSGGLGWGFPAAMGYKMARPERTVIAATGDGSHIFANPVACHQIAEALGISIIVIVLNNREWGAVRKSVLDIYPDGYASRANTIPLTSLAPSPDFTQVAMASRAWARHVATADAFEAALADALAHVEANRGLALIEVAVAAG
ncbi:MAG: thiamine pyrophosphate-requiring protein [Pseudomonadota bacterium]